LLKEGIAFIIGNKVCKPVFAVAGWYRPWKREPAGPAFSGQTALNDAAMGFRQSVAVPICIE
jgi:hypothetical protein